MISYSGQEKAAIDIALLLDGFYYSDAKAILDLAHEKILGSLKVNLSEDDLKTQTEKTMKFLGQYFATDPTNPANHARNSKPCL